MHKAEQVEHNKLLALHHSFGDTHINTNKFLITDFKISTYPCNETKRMNYHVWENMIIKLHYEGCIFFFEDWFNS